MAFPFSLSCSAIPYGQVADTLFLKPDCVRTAESTLRRSK